MRISDWSSDVCSSDLSSQFQCCKANKNQHHADNPESHHHLGFFPAPDFKVMMQRRHAQNPAPLPISLFRVFEIRHLQHHRQGFNNEYPTHDEKYDLLAHDHRNRDKRSEESRVGKEGVSTCRYWW